MEATTRFSRSAHFTPYYIDIDVDNYLYFLHTNQLPYSMTQESLPKHSAVSESLSIPPRNVAADVIQALIYAIKHKKRLEVDYVSVSHPDRDGRIIQPHTFINTRLRWHVRGYCEKSKEFRDFVLNRFRGTPEVLDDATHLISQDASWNNEITLKLGADKRLSKEQQAVINSDYQMVDEQLVIQIRAAMANYLLKEMQVNTKVIDEKPEAQQLLLLNYEEVKEWLY